MTQMIHLGRPQNEREDGPGIPHCRPFVRNGGAIRLQWVSLTHEHVTCKRCQRSIAAAARP